MVKSWSWCGGKQYSSVRLSSCCDVWGLQTRQCKNTVWMITQKIKPGKWRAGEGRMCVGKLNTSVNTASLIYLNWWWQIWSLTLFFFLNKFHYIEWLGKGWRSICDMLSGWQQMNQLGLQRSLTSCHRICWASNERSTKTISHCLYLVSIPLN